MISNKKNKTVLVTGGAGFLGYHIIEYILEKTDWKIEILDSLNYAGNMNRMVELISSNSYSRRIKFIWHDLRAPISLTTHKILGKIDYCIHTAAESHVDRSIEDSVPFMSSNVLGTANLLEYFKKKHSDCKTLIFSTDEVFGSAPKGICFEEDCQLRPSNPYAASKAGEEMVAFSFAHSFGLPISIVRSTNIIGEKQNSEKFIPKTIKSILSNKKVVLHGKNRNDLTSRSWIYAKDVTDGLLFLLDKAKREEFYHIAGEERNVLEIADWICEAIKGRKLKNAEIEFINYRNARPGHDKRYMLSDKKIKNMGWKLTSKLEESVKKITEWTLENREWL